MAANLNRLSPFYSTLLRIYFIAILASACSTKPAQKEKVTFIIPIQSAWFSQDSTLTINIWTAEQLNILAKQADCAVVHSSEDPAEQIVCPAGVVYQEVIPENFTFPIREIGERITVLSNTISVGEEYEIHLFGKSADNCNTTSASFREVAPTKQVSLEDLEWGMTLMFCSPAP